MKTVRSSRFLLFALLMLTAASFGCKHAPKPVNPPGVEGVPGSENPNGPGLETMRPTTEPTDASSVLKTVYFDFDKTEIRGDQQNTLDENAQYLKEHKDVKVQITGNCDERGTVEYNLALGDRRAKSVRSYLMEKGIDGSRMVTTSKGSEDPAVEGHGEDAWAKNRRAQFSFVQ